MTEYNTNSHSNKFLIRLNNQLRPSFPSFSSLTFGNNAFQGNGFPICLPIRLDSQKKKPILSYNGYSNNVSLYSVNFFSFIMCCTKKSITVLLSFLVICFYCLNILMLMKFGRLVKKLIQLQLKLSCCVIWKRLQYFF